MASYIELRGLFTDDVLVNRTAVAVVIAVNTILEGTPTANDKAYANTVLSDPQGEATKVLMTVLAANKAADVSVIQAASDATLQTKVDAIVPHLIDALAGV